MNAAQDRARRRVLVTGGAGFIGSMLCRRLIADGHAVVAVDCLTYAGNRASLAPIADHPDFCFLPFDIAQQDRLAAVLAERSIDTVMHLAAESHVDRAIAAPGRFLETNVMGSFALLQAVRRYLEHDGGVAAEVRARFRLIHVSTDEVFGDLPPDAPAWTEDAPYRPSSPYSASKAASDHLAESWHRSYGVPAIVTHGANTYGPRQYPEKLIPLTILRAAAGRTVPIYGSGDQLRDWIHVEDHVAALLQIVQRAAPGTRYNIGAADRRDNLSVVRAVCALLDAQRPRADGTAHARLIRFVADRPGHDRRYAIDAGKLRAETGWSPGIAFEDGLRDTVAWYLAHPAWLSGFAPPPQ